MLPVRSLVDKSFKYQRRIRKAAKVPHIKQFFCKKNSLTYTIWRYTNLLTDIFAEKNI